MREDFLTITEAVRYTGKSRRTLHRLAQQLAQTAPDQVLRERTSQGVIWRIHQQSLPPGASAHQSTHDERNQSPASLPALAPTPCEEKYLVIEALLHEKDRRIQALTEALAQSRRGFWQRLFGN